MKNPNTQPHAERLSRAMPGFGFTEHAALAEAAEIDPDPASTFRETGRALRAFVGSRDPIMFLGRTGLRFLQSTIKDVTGSKPDFDQSTAELLQTIALTMPMGPEVPTSPDNMERGWSLAQRNLRAYPDYAFSGESAEPMDVLSRRARIQTLHYRNIFNSEDAKSIVPSLLARIDAQSEECLGYRLSDVARAMYRIFDDIAGRVDRMLQKVRPLFRGEFDPEHVSRLLDTSRMARRAWRFAEKRFVEREELASAAFQMTEMLWGQVFTFTRTRLEREFGTAITEALFAASLRFGDLADQDAGTLYMDSPVRRKPFIRVSEDELFLPLPALLVSFPFEIIEAQLGEDADLLKAYADARTRYLEDAVGEIVCRALPSATVYRSVRWTDPDGGAQYENDVVAKLGNHIFIFEAKSGKLKPATRRGGLKSLLKNFKQLYVDPGRQAFRLEALLHQGEQAASLLKDRRGKPIGIDLTRPVVVHSFGVCIEHLASITSNRRHFEAIGLLEAHDPWSPILSIGELRMLSNYLDTELWFFHYLTRRSSIERLIDFVGDEQDLLSVYLTNGFHFDFDAIRGFRVLFDNADQPVRGLKVPRENRCELAASIWPLPHLWRRIVTQIYEMDSAHRFDMLEAILNVHPGALSGLEERVRKWRSGFGRGAQGLQFAHIELADRTYAVAMLLERDYPAFDIGWHAQAREVAMVVQAECMATDCVVLLKVRKSKASFDAISFFRMKKADATV